MVRRRRRGGAMVRRCNYIRGEDQKGEMGPIMSIIVTFVV